MTAMTTNNSTNVKAPLGKNLPAGWRMLQVASRKPVVENFLGIGFAPILHLFQFL
jgi:hypothetical protein